MTDTQCIAIMAASWWATNPAPFKGQENALKKAVEIFNKAQDLMATGSNASRKQGEPVTWTLR